VKQKWVAPLLAVADHGHPRAGHTGGETRRNFQFQRLSPEQTGTKGNPSTDGGCHMDSSVKTTGSLPSMPVPQFRGGRALI
jgi:hypothetical protein